MTGPGSLHDHDGVRLIAAPGQEAPLRAWLDAHGTLMAAARAHPEVRDLEGRGPVGLVPAPGMAAGERWVVRHYHRGGAVARVLGDLYLRTGRPRPEREYRLLTTLGRLGVPAPEPVGAAVYGAGPFYRGDLVTRWVPDSVDLATFVFLEPDAPAPDAVEAAMVAAGRLVRLLHERGVVHRDLNLKNILLVGAGRPGEPVALVLDLDRATLRGRLGQRARQAMIDRFWRSAGKWERRTGRRVVVALRPAFEAGYAAPPTRRDG